MRRPRRPSDAAVRPALALRLALRELRGGLAGFGVLIACLALGVASIAAVGSVRAAIEAGIAGEASTLLGGDAEITFAYRFADDEELRWMREHAAALSETVDFRSLAASATGERALVQVAAVDDAYPLFGTVALAGGGGIAEALAVVDGRPGLVAERLLADRLGLRVGDPITLGTRIFRLSSIADAIPDGGGAIAFGPRVIVRLADLDGSGLLAEGALFDSEYRLRLAPDADLGGLEADAAARFADRGLQWRDRRDGAPGVSRFVDRLAAFLTLIGLAGLAVGGIGVAVAARAHIEARTPTIATLKTLGAEGWLVFSVYLVEVGLIALCGIALGVGLGAALPLLAAPLAEGRLPVPAAFGLYPVPLAEAALYGLLTALAFTLLPLARVLAVRPAALYRDHNAPGRPRATALAATLGAALALVGSAAYLSGAPWLAVAVAGGLVAALVLLAMAARGLVALAKRTGNGPMVRGRPALRWALAALGAPGGDAVPAVLALGLGLGVLAAIGQVDANLRRLVARDLPARAPAFFFVDIQDDQLAGFRDAAAEIPGVGQIESAPMLRGVLTRINGRPAREVAGPHWVLNGDRGVSFAATPPPGTTLSEGSWWPEDYAGPPLVSFAAEEARELGLKLGDRLTVNILGRDIEATIASLREVHFESMGIGFVMIMNPAALAGAPHTSIATVDATPAAEGPLVRVVAGNWPNITAIPVREGIARVAALLDGIAAAARWAALATLSTGLVVLVGAAAAGERRRVVEVAVLKTLGATRRRILASLALRAALTGTAAGAVAIVAGCAAGWAVTRFLLGAAYAPALWSALGIVAGGALVSLLAGLAFALRPLGARPARVLRARE